jgi:teichoic acid transport system permease protein
MTDMAIADSHSDASLKQLAARHGLSVAGAQPTLGAYVRQLWSYRHFIAAYANARLVAQFSTARLGRIWQVLNPITNAAVYFLIFGIVMGARGGVSNFIAYLCTGIFIFSFTQTAVLSGVQSISGNLGLIRALHFPRASLPMAMTLMQFQNLLVSIVVLAGIVLITGEPFTLNWLLLVPALLLQALFNGGLALAMARLGAKVTDLKQIVPFVTRTWMYASGVMYSVELFERHLPPVLAQLMLANPLLVYIELARHALIDSGQPVAALPQLWALGIGWALVAVVGGFVYFWRGEREYGRG